MSDSWRVALPVAGGVLVLDQLSKLLIERIFVLHQELVLLPFLSLQLTYNTGAAFSLLHDAGGWQRGFLSAVSIAIMVWLGVWIHRLTSEERRLLWPLALILGGAAGNLIDRLSTGAVTDFIVLHYRDWHWPTFNAADAAISLGVIALIFLSLRRTSG